MTNWELTSLLSNSRSLENANLSWCHIRGLLLHELSERGQEVGRCGSACFTPFLRQNPLMWYFSLLYLISLLSGSKDICSFPRGAGFSWDKRQYHQHHQYYFLSSCLFPTPVLCETSTGILGTLGWTLTPRKSDGEVMKKIRQGVGVLLSLQLPCQEPFVDQRTSSYSLGYTEIEQESWRSTSSLSCPKLVLNSLRYICPSSSLVIVLQTSKWKFMCS